MKIGNVSLKNKVIAAPMAGISNKAYREILASQGAGLVCAEMVSDKAIVYKNDRTLKMLEVSKKEHPISMQLFGYDLSSMVEAAKILDKKCDCDIIDINLGCPVPKVVKTGAGSAMMNDIDHTVSVVEAIVKAVKKPVTVKMRLGWDHNSINCVALAKKLEKAGVSAITLHARTRSDFYSGKADWSYIKKIKETVKIPVIGNGDITCGEDAERMLEETNCDAIMIGRALLGNPFLVKDIVYYLKTGKHLPKVSLYRKVCMCLKHATALMKLYNSETLAIKEMRSHACYYIKGEKNASKYKTAIHSVTTYNELKKLLNKYLEECRKG